MTGDKLKLIIKIRKFLKEIMADFVNHLRSLTHSDRFHRTSALSPLLRIIAVIFPTSCLAIYYAQDLYVKGFFGFIILVFLFYFLLKHETLFKTDRNRLHSEDYLYAKEELGIMAQKERKINTMPIPNNNSENLLSPGQVVERGQKIYTDQLKAKLEPSENGRFVVIDVESGEYFIADTLVEALEKAKDKYPNKLFHTIKVGFEGVFKMGTYSRTGFSYVLHPAR